MNRSQIGILLVGHGSHLSPDSATPVHALVRRIEEVGGEKFGQVRAAFWKEEPELRYALDLMECREVFVIPVFTSAGYFTERVVPRELRLDGPLTVRSGRRIHYSQPVGMHSGMGKIALARAQESAPLTPEERAQTTLVIVGHGTVLHPGSEGTTQSLVGRLQGEGYRAVLPAFLDQEPRLEEVLSSIAGRVVVVPFFISEGWHAGTTIPRDLGGFELHYARAMGTHPRMADIVCEIVEELVGSGADGSPTELIAADSEEPCLPVSRAREAFLASLQDAGSGPVRLLQVELRRGSAGGGFEIRHVEDWQPGVVELRSLSEPADWNALATRTSAGAHRPLRSSPNLDRGWRFVAGSPAEAWRFLDSLYPGALFQKYQSIRGELPIISFRQIAGRQTGIHARVGELTEGGVEALVREVCALSRCLRTPVWHGSPPTGSGLEREDRGESGRDEGREGAISLGNLPCPEPCSVFITAAATQVAEGA